MQLFAIDLINICMYGRMRLERIRHGEAGGEVTKIDEKLAKNTISI